MPLETARFPRSSPYWPVVSHPLLRRVLPGLAVSALGDGMAVVAVTWLAIQLAPHGQRGTWIALAMAAYTLPSAAGTVIFGRLLRGRSGAQLAGWDAILRAAALAAIPLAHLAGVLTVGLYVVLLAASALLHSWGSAGRFTLIAELLPPAHHLPANAALTTISGFATIVGPPLAGILIGWAGPVWVIAIDAATFAVLALTYRLVLAPAGRVRRPARGASRTAGFSVIRHNRALLGLLVLSLGFFFLFGPVYVAMPIHITDDLHASATLLGSYYTAFGVGGLVGGVVAATCAAGRCGPPPSASSSGSASPCCRSVWARLSACLCRPSPSRASSGRRTCPRRWRCSSAARPPHSSRRCWLRTVPSWCWRCHWAPCWAALWWVPSAPARRCCSAPRRSWPSA
ncbi:MFS transporter [Micromonospora sp. RHAY321]|nr:MFS transporter [Micromonospora sp. RHAY321]MCO1598395.1 MFS transporter [Micromonospora sp. RHAY321]